MKLTAAEKTNVQSLKGKKRLQAMRENLINHPDAHSADELVAWVPGFNPTANPDVNVIPGYPDTYSAVTVSAFIGLIKTRMTEVNAKTEHDYSSKIEKCSLAQIRKCTFLIWIPTPRFAGIASIDVPNVPNEEKYGTTKDKNILWYVRMEWNRRDYINFREAAAADEKSFVKPAP
jgi:hypothetical protein